VNSKPSDVSVSFSGMLTRPAGHEANAEAEARKNEAEDDAEAQFFFEPRPRPQFMMPRPRPDTLVSNSVCMSMKTKLLAFRT